MNRFREKEDQKEEVHQQELDQQRRRKVLTMRSNGMALLSLDSLASIAPRGSRRRQQSDFRFFFSLLLSSSLFFFSFSSFFFKKAFRKKKRLSSVILVSGFVMSYNEYRSVPYMYYSLLFIIRRYMYFKGAQMIGFLLLIRVCLTRPEGSPAYKKDRRKVGRKSSFHCYYT